MAELKLFIWRDVLCDYTCGMVAILAHDLGEARNLAAKQFEMDSEREAVMREPTHVAEEPAAFCVWGGG